ncbi:MAG TPA: SdiA-regulated domain-containing protein [Chitinophagaceae bacterium]|nr:SdiA-regulated domain-containing protein [Chitinophagaceae bacterium]
MSFLNFRIRHNQLLLVLSILLISSCKQKKKLIKSPPGYNFSQAQEYKLDIKLKEISGIAWDDARNEFLAHYDESGSLFLLDKASLYIKPGSPYKIAGKGDYEDVAIYKGTPYVLRSDGMITKVIRDSTGMRGVEVGKIDISGTNDFEAMYADTARKALVIVCKNCEMDSKHEVSAFAFYPDSIGFVNDPVYRMNADSIKAMSPNKTSKFQPSAASIHPVSKKLFIISSAANQFVIADLDGKPEMVTELGKKLFPQPEGITFKNNGDMYISNEGVSSKGTVLRFEYKPK